MDNSFHYLLMANQAILHKKLLTLLKPLGLTLGQPKVLDYLLEHNGAPQKEIASACHIEAASLTAVLNKMEEKEIITRRMLNGNRRSYHIFLTARGETLAAEVSRTFRQLEEELFENISPRDRQHFMEIFSKIYENLKDEKEMA